MPGDPARREPARVDADAFTRDARARLRAYFAYATALGIDPDDVVQETLITARRNADRFDSAERLYRWCQVVGANKIRSLTVTAYHRREEPHADPRDAATRDVVVDAEEVAINKLDLDRVVGELPKHYREVLLAARDGRRLEDIAADRGLSYGAAKQLLHRARVAAQEALGRLYPGVVVPLKWRVRLRFRRVTGDPATSALTGHAAVVASVVTLSLVATLSLPSAGRESGALSSPQTPRPQRLAAPSARATGPHRGTAARSGAVRRPARTAGASTTTGAEPGTRLPVPVPVPVPSVSGKCAAGVCVGDPPPGTPGDTVYVKPLGEDAPTTVTQNRIPACPHVPDNPAVGCRAGASPAPSAGPASPTPSANPEEPPL